MKSVPFVDLFSTSFEFFRSIFIAFGMFTSISADLCMALIAQGDSVVDIVSSFFFLIYMGDFYICSTCFFTETAVTIRPQKTLQFHILSEGFSHVFSLHN